MDPSAAAVFTGLAASGQAAAERALRAQTPDIPEKQRNF
jgi:hypothetical protein